MVRENQHERKVEEIMSSEVVTVAPENSLYEAARIMGEKRVGSLIVVKYDTPVGIITERDLLSKAVCSGIDLEKDWLVGGVSIKEEKLRKLCPTRLSPYPLNPA